MKIFVHTIHFNQISYMLNESNINLGRSMVFRTNTFLKFYVIMDKSSNLTLLLCGLLSVCAHVCVYTDAQRPQVSSTAFNYHSQH